MKRKADTTTPMGSSFEGGYTTPTIEQQSGPKPAKISTRRESGRQKKVCYYYSITQYKQDNTIVATHLELIFR